MRDRGEGGREWGEGERGREGGRESPYLPQQWLLIDLIV